MKKKNLIIQYVKKLKKKNLILDCLLQILSPFSIFLLFLAHNACVLSWISSYIKETQLLIMMHGQPSGQKIWHLNVYVNLSFFLFYALSVASFEQGFRSITFENMNQLMLYLNMLFITTNSRSTRIWGVFG